MSTPETETGFTGDRHPDFTYDFRNTTQRHRPLSFPSEKYAHYFGWNDDGELERVIPRHGAYDKDIDSQFSLYRNYSTGPDGFRSAQLLIEVMGKQSANISPAILVGSKQCATPIIPDNYVYGGVVVRLGSGDLLAIHKPEYSVQAHPGVYQFYYITETIDPQQERLFLSKVEQILDDRGHGYNWSRNGPGGWKFDNLDDGHTFSFFHLGEDYNWQEVLEILMRPDTQALRGSLTGVDTGDYREVTQRYIQLLSAVYGVHDSIAVFEGIRHRLAINEIIRSDAGSDRYSEDPFYRQHVGRGEQIFNSYMSFRSAQTFLERLRKTDGYVLQFMAHLLKSPGMFPDSKESKNSETLSVFAKQCLPYYRTVVQNLEWYLSFIQKRQKGKKRGREVRKAADSDGYFIHPVSHYHVSLDIAFHDNPFLNKLPGR